MAHPESDYRSLLYSRYVSAFKGRQSGAPNYLFSDSKLIPLIKDWVKAIDRNRPCIDLGCGDGSMLHALRTLGFKEIAGIDLSAEQVALAGAVCPNVKCGDLLTEMAFYPDNHFGLITVFDVIEHLRKDEILRLLAGVVAKLAPGGTVIFHCPNGDSPWAQSVLASDFTHETLLAPASAQNLCAIFELRGFEAREHLGASLAIKGRLRQWMWRILRNAVIAWNAIETASPGSGIYTRNFAFKAQKQ